MRNVRTKVRRGFTLVEAALSIALVGGLLAASLQAVSGIGAQRQTTLERARGFVLAKMLMEEIMALPYLEPGVTSSTIGPGAGENATGNRSLFDDVDDYNGWKEEPPADKDGGKITGFEGWSREVSVQWVDPDDGKTVKASDTRVKKITVKAKRNGVIVTLSALRARAYDAAVEFPGGASVSSMTRTTGTSVGTKP